MANLTLRTPDDVRRLFSALGDDLTHESGGLSVSDIDQMSLEAMEEVDPTGLALTLVVALLSGFIAIRGYERNSESMGWGLTWAGLGFMFPVPSLLYTSLNRS